MKQFISVISLIALFCSMLLIGSLCSYQGLAESVALGDVNSDKQIDMKDVLLLRKYLGKMISQNEIYFAYADCNQDGSIDMKDVLVIRKYLAHMGTIASKPTTTKATTTTIPAKYDISHEDPRINFVKSEGITMGVWWWTYYMSTPANGRDTYLDFLEKNEVTEIYFYCMSHLGTETERAAVHEFVQAANRRGMGVSVLFDNQNVINPTLSNCTKLVLQYLKEYPDDNVYGIHIDIEPTAKDRVNNDTWRAWTQNYVSNLLPQVVEARKSGLIVELDMGCNWNGFGRGLTYTGPITDMYREAKNPVSAEDGSYTMDFIDCVANSCDVLCAMAYRDEAKKIMTFANPVRKAADRAGTKIVYGVETGNAGDGPQTEFYEESQEFMYLQLSKLLTLLDRDPPVVKYGLAIHYVKAWYNLRATDEPDESVETS